MANIIKPKRSSTASLVPTTSNLASGEMGVNMADQKIYINNGTSVVQIGAGKLSGHVDVTLTSLTSGQVLQWNGTAWVNVTGGGTTTNSLTAGSGLSGTAFNGSAAVTWTLATAYGDTINPYASKTANYVLAAPNGTAGAPTFRALVAADIPTLNQNTTGTAANVTGTVAVANGGTGATSANAALNNLQGYTTTATAAGTTTLTATSTYKQYFTGATTQTVVMPDVTTLALGRSYEIINNSTGALTVNSSGANLITTIPAGLSGVVTCIAITGATAASWHYEYASFDSITGSGACVFATSPTLVTPALGTPSSGNFSTGTFTWPTFNQSTTGSAATLTTGRTIGITGDITYTSPSFNGSANVTAAATLATVNANVGTFGSASAIPVVTVNAKGLVTGVTTATVAGGQYFGSAATKAIAYNSNSIAENVTVTAGNNGLSAGPVSIASGNTVTIESGANWVIV